MRLLPAMLLFGGCASAYPQVHRFPGLNLTVIVAPPNNVEKNCNARVLDSGRMRTTRDDITGCWKESKREIWVDWDRPGTLLHELCHADGTRTREECSRVKW